MAPGFLYRILAVAVSVLPLRVRRAIWSYLIVAGSKRWQRESNAQRIPGGMYVKFGLTIRPTQGEAMRFVGARTSLPVPVVVDNLTIGESTWLVMSRLPGYNLLDVYTEITPEVEARLSEQLRPMLASLRAIPAPSPRVCGFDQGPIYCERLAFGSPPLGPFESTDAFHRYPLLRARTLNIPEDVDSALVEETIRRAHSRPHRICLTHNDLGAHNVLVDENWNITGIVDWESCAWMPEYWELTKGTYLPQFRKGRWNRIMSVVFPEYADELQAERYIVRFRDRYT